MNKWALVAVLATILLVPAAPGWTEGRAETEGEEDTLGVAAAGSIVLWTTEEQPERMDVQREIASRFQQETGISVEVVAVTENLMGERATAAYSAGELPDLIYHPLNFSLSWYEAGILDAVAATEVIEELGADTYSAGILNLVQVEEGYAAVPVDGWAQLLVYRQDLFEEAGLEPPTTYSAILAAIEALHDPPNMYGFVAATDPAQVYMMQVFEHVALANGAQIVDENGNVTVDTPQMIAALEFYKQLAEASPPGNLYWEQSRELYMGGRAAMIIWSPFIMDELAGLRNDVPVTAFDDPTTDELARRTGFITSLAGPDNPQGAGWADVRYFGITADADVEAARQFVTFSMDESYLDTLDIAPEGKFPVRHGTADEPQRFVEGWKQLSFGVDRQAAPGEIYPNEVVQRLLEGLETGTRWGFPYGQGALTSRLYDTRVFAELIREYIDGRRSVEETARLMQQEAEALRQ